MLPFDRLRRFRLCSAPPSSLPQFPTEPDNGNPQFIVFPAPKHPRKSADIRVTSDDDARITHGAPNAVSHGTQIAFLDDNTPHAHGWPSNSCSSKSGAVSDPIDASRLSPKPTLIRRVTSKLNISITGSMRSRPSSRTLSADAKSPPRGHLVHRATIAASPTLPDSVVSRRRREAALRERGLRPPLKDLSEQEREADQLLGSTPSPVSASFDGSTEAERLKANWLANNRSRDNSDSPDSAPHLSLYSEVTSTGPQSMPALPTSFISSSDVDVRQSGESKTDPPCAGRPSMCSSLPPLSTSSYLEVLHEEPLEQSPITPPPTSLLRLPIIVSSPLDDSSTPIIVESPVSCTFSSQCPGSTWESSSQSDHGAPVFEKENIWSPGCRIRTGDSGHRPRKVVSPSLSMFGTRSLTNLRRSMTEGLERTSTRTSTLSSTDHSSCMGQIPRTAVSPTIHSLGSILKETRAIEDAESRRLSELAFLD